MSQLVIGCFGSSERAPKLAKLARLPYSRNKILFELIIFFSEIVHHTHSF